MKKIFNKNQLFFNYFQSILKPLMIISLFVLSVSLLTTGCYNFNKNFKGTLSGTILLRNTEIPIPHVKITIESLKDTSSFVIYSDDEGKFRLDEVHFGLNKVSFLKKNYYTLTKYADIRKDDNFILNIEMREVALNKLIFTTVKVLDSITKKPIPEALIDIYTKEGVKDYKFWDFYSSRYSNPHGLATFFLGSLAKKETADIEARLASVGYKEAVINYTLYYQDKQETIIVELEPAE